MMVEDEVVASHEDTFFASTSSSPPLTTTTSSFALFESEIIGWERVADENSASQGFNDGGDDDSLCFFIICLEVAHLIDGGIGPL